MGNTKLSTSTADGTGGESDFSGKGRFSDKHTFPIFRSDLEKIISHCKIHI